MGKRKSTTILKAIMIIIPVIVLLVACIVFGYNLIVQKRTEKIKQMVHSAEYTRDENRTFLDLNQYVLINNYSEYQQYYNELTSVQNYGASTNTLKQLEGINQSISEAFFIDKSIVLFKVSDWVGGWMSSDITNITYNNHQISINVVKEYEYHALAALEVGQIYFVPVDKNIKTVDITVNTERENFIPTFAFGMIIFEIVLMMIYGGITHNRKIISLGIILLVVLIGTPFWMRIFRTTDVDIAHKPIQVEEQKLTTPERKGFVAVEWGGTELK